MPGTVPDVDAMPPVAEDEDPRRPCADSRCGRAGRFGSGIRGKYSAGPLVRRGEGAEGKADEGERSPRP